MIDLPMLFSHFLITRTGFCGATHSVHHKIADFMARNHIMWIKLGCPIFVGVCGVDLVGFGMHNL